ncbi:antitoxin of toxin-antitoxin stability system [Actimicrobium antarcticum]|uniref:CopG family transcriptional regulator n=1 Tax=Actimicrobium antarcticum TaxID=1051899 RepID=A0ABP7SYB3_9BURK
MIAKPETTITFRVSSELAEQTRLFAKSSDQRVSEYIRDAVREKNARQIADRMRFLSLRLAAENAKVSQEFDIAAGDGIA